MHIAEYVGLFLLVASSRAGIPVVGDAALIAAGTLAGEGRLNVWIVLVLAVAGWMVGSFAGYEIGARCGRRLLDQPGKLEESRRKLLKKGELAFGRYTFVASAKMKAYMSGIFHVRPKEFALASAIWGIVRIAAYTALSYFPGADVALSIGKAGGGVVLGVLVVVAAGLAIKAAYSMWEARVR